MNLSPLEKQTYKIAYWVLTVYRAFELMTVMGSMATGMALEQYKELEGQLWVHTQLYIS